MSARGRWIGNLLCCALTGVAVGNSITPASGQDVFATRKYVPGSVGAPIIESSLVPAVRLDQPLTLQTAITLALTNDPKVREQWAGIKVQAATLGSAYSAYLPTLNGSLQGAREEAGTAVIDNPQFNSNTWANTDSESVSLSWVLYDFGGRDSGLANAKALLIAAEANHEEALREIFAQVTKDYYAAQAAKGAKATAVANKLTAEDGYDVAKDRADKGVSPLSDELQAETALDQAEVSVTQANGDYKVAEGALAADMGLSPDSELVLPDVDTVVEPNADFQASVKALIQDAIERHPSVREAKGELAAAEAKVRQVRAQGRPTLSLIGKSSRSDEPLNEEVGVSSFKATETDSYLGAQVSIPLFDGFANDYQIRQYQAEAEERRYEVDEARQKVGLDLWKSYQEMETAGLNLANNAKLLKVAQKSYDVAQGRYTAGVGSMIERLEAQSALASARLGWIKALANWRASRLDLASNLGMMGTWWKNAR